jgi:acyl dehydratase
MPVIDYSTYVGALGQARAVRVTADLVRRFAQTVHDGHPWHHLPEAARARGAADLLAPPTLPFVLSLSAATLPFPLEGLVHVEQSFTYHQPLLAGQEVVCRLALRNARSRGEGDRRTWLLTVEATGDTPEGEAVFRASSRLVHRPPRLGAAAAPAEPTPVPTASRPVRTVLLTRDDLRAYAQVAKDPNPIHLDDDAARSYGLDGVIAHGMLTMALLAQPAEEWAEAGLASLSARFVRPVRPGETLSVRASVEGEGLDATLLLHLMGPDGTVRVVGRAVSR